MVNEIWSALSDPIRRRILQLLKERNMSAGEIADNFDISKPSISHHLNQLKNAELVSCERNGQSMMYSLNTSAFSEILEYFSTVL